MIILTLKSAALQLFLYLAASFLFHFSLQSFFLDVFLWRHTSHFLALPGYILQIYLTRTDNSEASESDVYIEKERENKLLHSAWRSMFFSLVKKTRMTTSISSEARRNQTSILIRGRENHVSPLTWRTDRQTDIRTDGHTDGYYYV